MNYTQDESYYILDCYDDGEVYLGLKEGIDKDEMINNLERSSKGEIPAGTLHCSGKNTMVLEISATPYIFTFKLWDWDRLVLDGLPRPIHLDHAINNIQWNRTTRWVK